MKRIQIEFSKYESVNYLWSELIEHFGFERAKKIVSQAIDLQKMNGTENITMPIIFSGTGGLALFPVNLLQEKITNSKFKKHHVLIFNIKKKLFQILNDTN